MPDKNERLLAAMPKLIANRLAVGFNVVVA
jgi:hypothetical protein